MVENNDVSAKLIYTPVEPEFQTVNRRFQGIPSIERTQRGRLFACFYGGELEEKAGNYAVVAISDDDGLTWKEPYCVVKHPDSDMRVFDPCLWIDPKGRLWLSWSQTKGYFDGRHGVWTAICHDPDEKEPCFSKPERIANGVMLNKPIVTRNGEWLYPCALWGPWIRSEESHPELEQERFANVVSTKDEGKTFVRLGGADIKNRCFDEHMLIERADGSLWMLARRFDGIGEAVSYDGGKTWIGGGHAGIAGPCSRFFIRRLRSGAILLVNHVDFRGRNNLAAKLSYDDGKTWSSGLLLDGRNDVSYPDGVEGNDGFIRVIYDRERLKAREILIAQFRELDIEKGHMDTRDDALIMRRIVSRAN